MLQAFNEPRQLGILRRHVAMQQIDDGHVRQGQHSLERGCRLRTKCSAAGRPKATQQQIQLQQTAAATPSDALGVV